MTDRDAVKILCMLDCVGMADAVRNHSVDRIQAFIELPTMVRRLKTDGCGIYLKGYEAAKRDVLKILEERRKATKW